MRFISFFICILFSAVLMGSCGERQVVERLSYQEQALYIEADVGIDGGCIPLTVELAAPNYDDNGRMLARDASVTVREGSILSGVGFETVGGEYYIKAGELCVPITAEETVSGIADIISLFCIDKSCYYSSESCTAHAECELAVYKSGDNSVEVHIGNSDGMPILIAAKIDGCELIADIKCIRAE